MSQLCHLLRRTVRWAQSLAPLLLAVALALSFATSLAVIVIKYLPVSPLPIVGAFAGLAGILAALGLGLNRLRLIDRPLRLTWVLALGLLVVRAGLVLSTGGYPQQADCEFFRDTVEIIAAEGLGNATIEKLSNVYYDDYLWVGRALPVFLGMRHLFGDNHVLAATLLNCALSSLTLFFVYGIGRRILSDRALSIGLLCYALLPVHTWLVLDYTHQVLGEFLAASGIWLALGILHEPGRVRATLFRGAGLGAVLVLLHLQSGIDYFLVLLLGVLIVYAWAEQPSWKQVRKPLLIALALPLIIYLPPSRAFSRWSDGYKPIRMSSHPISFTARGWSLETGGEYDGKFEQLDREAPHPRKAETMRSVIVSQFYYYPVQTTMVLPVIKAAKYFLVGYATAIESRLESSGHAGLAAWFIYTKLCAAPLFLLGAIAGCILLWVRRPEDVPRNWIIAIPLLFFLVYLVFGETSPRYSFHVHFALALLAGYGFAEGGTWLRERSARQEWGDLVEVGALLKDATALLGLWLTCALLAAGAARILGQDHVFQDMRKAQVLPETNSEAPTHLSAMEHWTMLPGPRQEPGSPMTVDIDLETGEPGDAVSFYLWPPTDRAYRIGASISVHLNDQLQETMPLAGLRHVLRREYTLPETPNGLPTLRLGISRKQGRTVPQADDSFLRWGYVKVHSQSKP